LEIDEIEKQLALKLAERDQLLLKKQDVEKDIDQARSEFRSKIIVLEQ